MSGRPGANVVERLRAGYGAGPLHLLSVLGCLALAGFLVTRLTAPGITVAVAVWFVGALLLHDLVLFPLYTLLDRGVLTLSRSTTSPVPWINHVRVPALLSGLLLLMWFPLITRVNGGYYAAVTGLSADPYRGRWLLAVAILFVGSGLLYALRVGWASRQRDDGPEQEGAADDPDIRSGTSR